MKIPLNWLAELVPHAEKATPEDVHFALVSVGFEEEAIHGSEISGPLVVGQVLDITPEQQKNGKIINWCQVRVSSENEKTVDGSGSIRGIVCGANNFKIGDKVVVTLPGAKLPGDFIISARKTYGHISDGMMASKKELGLGQEHDGIIVLSDMGLDPEVGSDAKEILGLNETAVEINVTPDRGYALSMRGIAREYAIATSSNIEDIADSIIAKEYNNENVIIDNSHKINNKNIVETFYTRKLSGINNNVSTPRWLSKRLELAGVRPISAVVDITNYVMLELGQPIHAYDATKIKGSLQVRRASVGEELVTIDAVKRILHPEDIVIADDSGPIGLAGVMGGQTTEISPESTEIVIESAVFDSVSIARSSRRHKLFSEASKRFERKIDKNISAKAAQRVVDLVLEICGGQDTAQGSSYFINEPAKTLTVPKNWAEKIIGIKYTEEEIINSLEKVGVSVQSSGSNYVLEPPSWRNDLDFAEAYVEEIARIIGYDAIPTVLPVAPPGKGLTKHQRLRKHVMNTLASIGSVEVLAYPFVTEQQNNCFGTQYSDTKVSQVKLANPLDSEKSMMRRSLIPGLLSIAKRNLSRGASDINIYESGFVFLPEENTSYGVDNVPRLGIYPGVENIEKLDKSIPSQRKNIAVLLTGNILKKQPNVDARSADYSDALEKVTQIANSLGVRLELEQAYHQAFHPGRTAAVYLLTSGGNKELIGYAGELLPSIAESYHLNKRVAIVELNLDSLIDAYKDDIEYKPISNYSAVFQDVTILVPTDTPAQKVAQVFSEAAGENLENYNLISDYRGEGLPEGYKSLSFSLKFTSNTTTLTAAEVNELKLAGVEASKKTLNAIWRE